jgi:hypothetical protein
MSKPSHAEILSTKRFVGDLNKEVTLLEYLRALLHKLIKEQDSFSGKHPFGNSGWHHDLYAFLVQSKAIRGHLDCEGNLDVYDDKAADKLLPVLVTAAMRGPA